MTARAIGALAVLLAVAALVAGCAGRPAVAAAPPRATGSERLDVAYAGASPSQVLDLRVPASTSGPVPLVVYLHGGGFRDGDEDEVGGLAPELLDAGYAVASVGYRLSDEAPFPAAPRDAKAAVRHLRAHASEYGLDPARFAVWGDSAGGNLAALVGLTGDRRTVLDDDALGNPGVPSSVRAVVDRYGPSDLAARANQGRDPGCRPSPAEVDAYIAVYLGGPAPTVPRVAAEASPITWVASAPRIPAFSIEHGTADCIVPVDQARTFAAALTAVGQRPDLRVLDGAQHGDARFDTELVGPTIRWLDGVLAR